MAANYQKEKPVSHTYDYESTDSEESDEEGLTLLQRAEHVRKSQGMFETEVWFGEEADSATLMKECKKNPGHYNFRHVSDFRQHHLPREYKERKLHRAIKTCADLTVKLSVFFTSRDRPEKYPGSDRLYPFYQSRGNFQYRRGGTGWVWKVEEYGEGKKEKSGPCECQECKGSDNPHKVWWEIIIMTAAHVVFDESECIKTYVTFWDEMKSKHCPVKLKGHGMGDSSIAADRGMFMCVTHDADFCRKLRTLCKRRAELTGYCDDKFCTNDVRGLSVVISHPHMDKKRITLGYGIARVDEELASYYSYDADTCFGSSGGFVWAVGWGSHHGSVAPHSYGYEKNSDYLFSTSHNKSGWSWPLN
ncbi:uncharacterized protein LOC101851797 isoform X2 [Aplysia californica]|nr:uncharacterized protein LOC101851797 isoform X2 [Aplysia californica]XP_005096759.1 uncharacterized protein LOC101851797 isoform X2 [Aplysia californica]XP_005096760.1 uncharacterized protein LOC101851797 isoform X2 [Aplysia californica]XP_012936997.1 uncharacterized protein LOC101851797 isoform X2 [Aplysia californica]